MTQFEGDVFLKKLKHFEFMISIFEFSCVQEIIGSCCSMQISFADLHVLIETKKDVSAIFFYNNNNKKTNQNKKTTKNQKSKKTKKTFEISRFIIKLNVSAVE